MISNLLALMERCLTLWFSDNTPGTVCEDAISPFSGVHVYMTQQLLSGHSFRIHCVLLHLQKHSIKALKMAHKIGTIVTYKLLNKCFK